ncbi:MAG: hypothetical protein UT60_C0059G0036 [candidate division CPR2 bacterium GW2011_GWD2_39_7]|nr:MAG: hypothetical protein UT60_C0059G0036 [candidate division CPR2 bacterium GW2011_GWD2_39_7]
MITHIAIFKWKPEVTKEEIEEAFNEIRSLRDKVEGLSDILCGENYNYSRCSGFGRYPGSSRCLSQPSRS